MSNTLPTAIESFPDVPAAVAYAEWASTYDAAPSLAHDLISKDIEQFLQGTACRIADVGCGTGRYSQLAASLGHEVVGIDPSKEMLDVARRFRPAAEYRLGRAEQLPMADAEVSIVISVYAFSHVIDLPAAMSEVSRVLGRGGSGLIATATPEAANQLGWNAAYMTAGGIRNIREIHFSVDDFKSALRNTHLSLIDVRLAHIIHEAVPKAALDSPTYPLQGNTAPAVQLLYFRKT